MNNYGGTALTNTIINTAGGDVIINSQVTVSGTKERLDLLEREGLCLLSLGKCCYALVQSAASSCLKHMLTSVGLGRVGGGLSELFVLQELFAKLNAGREATGLRKVKPWEVFDMMGGTGAGG
jgi:hypothetical protein